MKVSPEKKRFQSINIATIVALFVLILAGGVVRSTGSGMGCPDWPKCFGQCIPPTNVSQIPKDYKDKYVAKRMVKNQKFAKMMAAFGFKDLADRIRNDKSILLPEEFNAAQTWTEYVNRLIGALTGILLLLAAVYSFSYAKDKKRIVAASILNVILVGIQAWLGSIVVSTNLVAGIVTVHMLLALAILAISIYTYHAARLNNYSDKVEVKSLIRFIVLAVLVLSTVQIALGTEVRERIDAISGRLQGQARESWVADAGSIFTNHRDLALLVFVFNVMLYALVRRAFSRHSIQQQIMSFSFLMIMLQIVTGIILSYNALPPAAQAIHIVLASLVFGAQFYLMLNLYRSAKVWGSN